MSNDDHSDDDDDQIHRVDTVPPPEGERDAYSAATRVGPMAEAVVMEMMHAAGVKAAELRARSDKKSEAATEARAASDSAKPAPPSAPPRPSAPRPAAPRLDARAEPADEATDADASIPRTYADEDEDNAETMLSPMAKPPSMPKAPHVPRAPMQTLPLAPQLARPVTEPIPLTPPLFPSQRPAPGSGAPAASTGTAAVPPSAPAPAPYPAPPWDRSAMETPKPLLGPRSLVVLAVCGSIFVIGLIMFLVSR
jgi:hypothetical protein